MKIPEPGELNSPKKKGILYMRKHYPEFAEFILRKYPHINKFNAGVYLYFHNMDHPLCPVCGKPVPFLDETRGFQVHCCAKCANNNPASTEQRRNTCIKKYGAPNPAQNEQIKQKAINTYTTRYGGMGNASASVKEKQHSTMTELYGSAHALQNEDIKQRAIDTANSHGGVGLANVKSKNKAHKTMEQRYGGWGLSSPELAEKITQTNIERYGVAIVTQNPDIVKKMKISKIKKRLADNPNILNISIKNGESICTMKCPHSWCQQCMSRTYDIPTNVLYDRERLGVEPCTNLLPLRSMPIKNTTPELFVKIILGSCGVKYEQSNRSILEGKELDFYIPSHKLAIECNGIYWHSAQVKDEDYHINKYLACKKQGIRLITIWQDQIIRDPDGVRRLIKNTLGTGDEPTDIVLQDVSSSEYKDFLNRLQSEDKIPPVRIGLYKKIYVNEDTNLIDLVAVAGFKKKKSGWWMTGFYEKTPVQNSMNILLNSFIKKYKPDHILTKTLNDATDGQLYESAGFKEISVKRSYWYIDKLYRRYSSSIFTKKTIENLGWAPLGSWNIQEVLYRRGFLTVYDSGRTIWRLELINS